MSETRLGSLNLDQFSLTWLAQLCLLTVLMDVLLETPELGLIDEQLLATAGLNQNMLATTGLLVNRLGPALHLDDLFLTVLCLEDQLLGRSHAWPASLL